MGNVISLQSTDFFRYSLVLIPKLKCLLLAGQICRGESGTPSTIISVRDAAVCIMDLDVMFRVSWQVITNAHDLLLVDSSLFLQSPAMDLRRNTRMGLSVRLPITFLWFLCISKQTVLGIGLKLITQSSLGQNFQNIVLDSHANFQEKLS